MDKWQALNEFWSGFGIPAYDESTVEQGVDFPRITYSVSTASLDEPVILTASLWFYGQGWEEASKAADMISEAIGRGGAVRQCDGGALWIKRGVPFAQRMSDPADILIRRIVLNLEAEYFSAD